MKGKNFSFNISDLDLSVPGIGQMLGFGEGECGGMFSEMIFSALEDAGKLPPAKAEYTIFEAVKFSDAERTIEINDIIFEVNRIVSSQLRGSDSIAVFLCTAGSGISAKSRQAMEAGDLLTGYIYDAVGNEIVDAAFHLLYKDLQKHTEVSGKKLTNRYNPGYCDWKVDEQEKLFRLMPDNYCGIRLNSSALMDPEKSVSGFIGIGRNVRFNSFTCGLCDRTDCIYREMKGRR